MTEEELQLELEQTAGEMGVHIRYEKGDFEGGYCILREEKIIVVNKKLSPTKKCSVIAQALGDYGIENVYMKPVVRTYVEDEIVRARELASKNIIRLKDDAVQHQIRESGGGATQQ